MLQNGKSYHAGWLFMADLSGRTGCESQGNMSVLIVSTEKHNTLSDSVIVVPCTQQMAHADWDQHVAIFAEEKDGTINPVIAMTEHLTEIDKSRLGRCLGKVNEVDYKEVVNNIINNTIRMDI